MEMSQKPKSTNKTSRYWQFTLWHYKDEDVQRLLNLSSDFVKYIIFGYENGKKEGKEGEHLQGYVELKNACRKNGVKEILDAKDGVKSAIHIGDKNGNPSSAKLRDFGVNYCKKGIQSHEEWEKMGVTGINYGKEVKFEEKWFIKPRLGQGARNDWVEVKDFIEQNPNFDKVLQEYPEYAIRYTCGIKAAIESVLNRQRTEEIKKQFENIKLRKWQKKLDEDLKYKPDERKVIWYVDPTGNSGKSTMCDYLKAKYDALGVQNGKTSDIAHAYKGQRIVTFDFTRSVEGQINYSVIESIKNGRIFSPKYDSVDKMFNKPWVVVMSNFEPNMAAFSIDRWDIRRVSADDCLPYEEEQMEKEVEHKVLNAPKVQIVQPKVEQYLALRGNTGSNERPVEQLEKNIDFEEIEKKSRKAINEPHDNSIERYLIDKRKEQTILKKNCGKCVDCKRKEKKISEAVYDMMGYEM